MVIPSTCPFSMHSPTLPSSHIVCCIRGPVPLSHSLTSLYLSHSFASLSVCLLSCLIASRPPNSMSPLPPFLYSTVWTIPSLFLLSLSMNDLSQTLLFVDWSDYRLFYCAYFSKKITLPLIQSSLRIYLDSKQRSS